MAVSNGDGTTKFRLDNLEKGHSDNRAGIAELHRRIDETNTDLVRQIALVDNEVRKVGKFDLSTLFQMLVPIISVVAGLWVLAISPLRATVESQGVALSAVERKLEERIYRVELNSPNKEALTERLERLGEHVGRIEREQMRRSDVIISRAEFDIRRGATDAAVTGLREQYLDLRRQMQELFPPSRTLQELLDRIKRLEDTRINGVKD